MRKSSLFILITIFCIFSVSGYALAVCTYSLNPTDVSRSATAGSGSVTVTTAPGCTWNATSNDGWIGIGTITSDGGAGNGYAGSGNGTVNFTFQANETGDWRSGTITIGDQTFTLYQNTCPFLLDPPSVSRSAVSGSGEFDITTGTGCTWNATSNAVWIGIGTITSDGGAGNGYAASGNGSVSFNIQANETGASRSGTITVSDQTFTVYQSTCTYTLDPLGINGVAGGDSGSFSILTSAGNCGWVPSSSDTWINIDSFSSAAGNAIVGVGDGTVTYSYDANETGATRSGTITIVDQTFAISQPPDPASCAYGLSPTSKSEPADSGFGYVGVTTGSGCPWNAASNDSWISVTSTNSGSGNGVNSGAGNGSVYFSFDANEAVASRSGTLTIGGQTFTLNQVGIDDGFCGFSNGAAFPAKPIGGLCWAGTASSVSGSGPWTWDCLGVNEGYPANCSADYSACNYIWILGNDGTDVYDTSIQSAYNTAVSSGGGILRIQAIEITEDNIQFDGDQDVTIEGGFDGCSYFIRDEDSFTAIVGKLTIGGLASSTGTVTIGNIVIK